MPLESAEDFFRTQDVFFLKGLFPRQKSSLSPKRGPFFLSLLQLFKKLPWSDLSPSKRKPKAVKSSEALSCTSFISTSDFALWISRTLFAQRSGLLCSGTAAKTQEGQWKHSNQRRGPWLSRADLHYRPRRGQPARPGISRKNIISFWRMSGDGTFILINQSIIV